jgi:phosphopantetheine--protein transferase-like protein
MSNILGIGTDIVAVERFVAWSTYSEAKLLRIFSRNELADCLREDGTYFPERLAARFAAKEAFYKALSNALFDLSYTQKNFSLLAICTMVAVDKNNEWQLPLLKVDWQAIGLLIQKSIPSIQTHLSLSHEKKIAQAFVVLSLG